jgi:hypothetical protein
MNLISSVRNFNNSNLFFSKDELTKILSCYSLGVSKGTWNDYSINYGKQHIAFMMYKHTLAEPNYILTKSNKYKKNLFFYDLEYNNKKKYKFKKIDDIIAIIKRNELKII